MQNTPKSTPRISSYLAGLLLFILLAFLAAPNALAGCNKNNKGPDCSPNPNPPSDGFAIVQIDDAVPCVCKGIDMAMPEMQLGPLYCNTTAEIANVAGDYYCAVAATDDVFLMTHHYPMNFLKKYREICNSLAFPTGSMGRPDQVLFGWTDDCYDGECAMTLNLEFSGAAVMSATGDRSDALSVVLNGVIHTAPEGDGNPFTTSQLVSLETMEFVFLQPGSTKLAGVCTFYLDGQESFVVDAIPTP